jgi:hypothetical protein
MCQSKHHMFISKKYVPIKNWKYLILHILYTISTSFFIWIQYFKPLMSRNILVTWRIKWMKNKNKWKINEYNLFTIESYVSIQVLPFHNREVCVNWNTTYSSPKGMFPLGIKIIWDCTFFIPFQLVFYLNSIFQTSYAYEHYCYLNNHTALFPPLHQNF